MVRGDNPGRRDIKITVEQATESRHATTGEKVYSWSNYAAVWGQQMKPPASNETYEADQQVAVQVSRYKIPYLGGLTEKMRFNIAGVYHYIKGIEEWDRRKYLAVTVERRDNV